MARTLAGTVATKSGDKTIAVTIKHSKVHPVYRKRYVRTTKVMAHDPKNQAGPGDQVIIAETKPLSARKRFILQSIVAKAGVAFKNEDATADVADTLEPIAPPAKVETTAAEPANAKEKK